MISSSDKLTAIEFDLPDIAGKRWVLSDFAEQWLLMVFHRHLG